MDEKMDIEVEIRFKTSDNKRVRFTESEATYSRVLKSMLENAQQVGQIDIQLPVNSAILTQVLSWCQGQLCENDAWRKEFLAKFKEDELLRLMHVANYLDIESLQTACCKVFANKWQGLKIEEIRKRYNIVNDLAPEEESLIIQENKNLSIGD